MFLVGIGRYTEASKCTATHQGKCPDRSDVLQRHRRVRAGLPSCTGRFRGERPPERQRQRATQLPAPAARGAISGGSLPFRYPTPGIDPTEDAGRVVTLWQTTGSTRRRGENATEILVGTGRRRPCSLVVRHDAAYRQRRRSHHVGDATSPSARSARFTRPRRRRRRWRARAASASSRPRRRDTCVLWRTGFSSRRDLWKSCQRDRMMR